MAGSPDEIRRDIERTREELDDTVEALAAKTDVKSRAKAQAEERKEEAREKVADVRERVGGAPPGSAAGAGAAVRGHPVPVVAAGAFVAGFVAGRLSRRG